MINFLQNMAQLALMMGKQYTLCKLRTEILILCKRISGLKSLKLYHLELPNAVCGTVS